MSEVKVLLYTSKVLKNGEHPIMLRVIKDRKPKYISIGYSSTPAMWDEENSLPKKKHPLQQTIILVIEKRIADARKYVLEKILDDKEYSAEEVIGKLKKKTNKMTVFSFFDLHIKRLKDANRIGNAKVYQATKNSLYNFRDGKDFLFSDINATFLNRYEESFLKRNVSLNAIFVPMRTLKTLINFARAEEIVRSDYDPFKDYSFKKFRGIVTKKRAISKEDIKRIEAMELKPGSCMNNSRNYFMFSFYCRGINFADMAFLKWSDIRNKRLEYVRKKTRKRLSVGLLDPALAILDYYRQTNYQGEDSYVFPVLNENHATAQSIENRTDKVLRMVNNDLKQIAKELDIKESLTTYVARHSYATIMKRSGAPLGIISESMGHQNERITQVYLDSFGNEVLDEVNRLIL